LNPAPGGHLHRMQETRLHAHGPDAPPGPQKRVAGAASDAGKPIISKSRGYHQKIELLFMFAFN
jgi:hypothetical protein